MDYGEFKTEVLHMTGIDLGCYKEKQMKRRIDSLVRKNGFLEYKDYVKALRLRKDLFSEFLNYITINVSEFFRNPEQWKVLESDIIPCLLDRFGNLRVWSAACSTGEEPYSLVMLLNRFLPLEEIRVLATDIDEFALEKAMKGEYQQKSLENLPQGFREKYFEKISDTAYRIREEVKSCVTFKRHNLLRDSFPKNFNLVLCRNVLIYFTEEAKERIYRNLNHTLEKDGVLFVGNTEQILMSGRYGFRSFKTFFYAKEEDLKKSK